MTDIETIAKGLSEAQKRLMKNHPFWATVRYTTIASCRQKGLLNGAELTPIGQAVLDYMKGEK